jgi:hypothetical protein
MACLFGLFASFFPRLGSLFIWLARPKLFSAAFGGNWLWPLLGIILLPFTTLMYVILWSPGIGLIGWDWFWLGTAVLIDLMHWSSLLYSNRSRVPGYQTTPKVV